MFSQGMKNEDIIFFVIFYIVGAIILHFLEKSNWW